MVTSALLLGLMLVPAGIGVRFATLRLNDGVVERHRSGIRHDAWQAVLTHQLRLCDVVTATGVAFVAFAAIANAVEPSRDAGLTIIATIGVVAWIPIIVIGRRMAKAFESTPGAA